MSYNAWLRIIGDVHGDIDNYISIANKAKYSIQVGDVGFNYLGLYALDPKYHKIIAGNHDNYTASSEIQLEVTGRKFIKQTEHFLGDFGIYTVPQFGDIFFVRGGNSIDKCDRTEYFDWWRDEELSQTVGIKALESYSAIKPDFVITHECPAGIIPYISRTTTFNGIPIRPSSTAHLLQAMFETHRPKRWLFGHHHRTITLNIYGTRFQCLESVAYPNSYIDFEKNNGSN